MTVDVIVQRENTLPYRAPDIVDPLITTEEVAVSRGKDFLAEEGAGMQPVVYEMPFQKGIRCGQLVKIRDAVLGINIKGKIIGIDIKLEKSGDYGAMTSMMQLTVNTPTSFEVVSDNSK